MHEALAACDMGAVMRAFRTHPFHGKDIPQEAAAGWVGITQARLSRIENGDQLTDLGKLMRWAHTLGIPTDLLWFRMPSTSPIHGDTSEAMSPLTRRALLTRGVATTALPMLGQDTTGQKDVPGLQTFSALSGTSWAGPIYDAVLHPTDAVRRARLELESDENSEQAEPPNLQRVASQVMEASLSSDYTELSRSLPRLIGQAEAASLFADTHDHNQLQRLLSDVYAVAGWSLIKADSPTAAWVAAQRAIQVAEQAGDVLRVAAATRCLAEVQMRAKNYEEATRTAFLAAVHLDTARQDDRTTALCLRGAALLSGAAAAARRGDSREAHTALKAAAVCADELGEDRTDLGTVFGPTNVAIHHVAVAVELGSAKEALRHVPSVRLDRMPAELTERRARFLIDVARSHAQVQDDAAALDALVQAETIAPDELREHRLTRELIRHLLLRERRGSGVRALAGRCNLLN